MSRSCSLKHVARLAYGDALAQECREDGGVPVFGSNGITGSHNVPNTRSPAIIVGRKGSFGKVTWSSEAGFCIDTAYYIDSRHTRENLRWLYWALQTLQLDVHSEDTGVPGLSREKAYGIKLRLPLLSEQVCIANFLDEKTARIDALIAEKERLLESLDEFWSSKLSWWMQAPAAHGACQLTSGWQVLSLKRLCSSITTGRTPSGARDDCFSDSGLCWVTPGDIQGLFVRSSTRRVTDIAVAEDEVRVYPAGSTLLVGIGATVGNAAHAKTSMSANQQINVLIPDREIVDPVFLTLLVMAHREQIRQGAGSATLPIINQEKTGRIQVAVPTLNEQRTLRDELLALRSRVDRLRIHAQEHISRLREYRSSLISAAVTGQLDIGTFNPSAEREAA